MPALFRRWLIGGICAALFVPLLAISVAVPSVAADGAFTDASGRFSFNVPNGWWEDEPEDGDIVVQFQVPNPLATFYVVTMPMPDDIELDDFIPSTFDTFSAGFENFHPSSQQDAVVGGEPAKQIDITATSNGHTVALSQIYTVHDGTVYVLTIATPSPSLNALKDQATQIIGSWEFL
jgi:hypothetical protein